MITIKYISEQYYSVTQYNIMEQYSLENQEIFELVSNWRSEVRRGALQLYLLSLIRKNSEMYGYQIVNELKQGTGILFGVKEGVLYPILRRLEKDQILASTWKTPMNGVNLSKPRKYYNLTEKGYQVLELMVQYWTGLTHNMNETLYKEDK